MDTRYMNTCYLLRVLLRERQESGHVVHNLVLLKLCVHAAEQTKLDLIGRKKMLLSSLVVFNREATTSNCPSIFRCRISLQLTSKPQFFNFLPFTYFIVFIPYSYVYTRKEPIKLYSCTTYVLQFLYCPVMSPRTSRPPLYRPQSFNRIRWPTTQEINSFTVKSPQIDKYIYRQIDRQIDR